MYPATLHLNGKRKHANPIYVGDDYNHEIVFLDEGNAPVSKTGVTILAQIRDENGVLIGEFNTAVGGTGNNEVSLSIPSVETKDFTPGDYFWDYQETEGGIVTTRLKGEALVVGDVSRSA